MGPLGQCGSQYAHPLHRTSKCRPGRSLPGRHGLLGLHHRAAMPTEATSLPPAKSIPTSGQVLLQSVSASSAGRPGVEGVGSCYQPPDLPEHLPSGQILLHSISNLGHPTLSGVRLPQALTSMALCGGIQTHRTQSTYASLLCDHVPIDPMTNSTDHT